MIVNVNLRLELDDGLDDSEFDEDGIIIQPHKEWQSTEKIRKTKVKIDISIKNSLFEIIAYLYHL